MDAIVEPTRQLVRLRGRSYLAFVFSPVVPIMEWLEDIDATLARSPGFFLGKPVVLDLATVDLSGSAITHLVMSLEKRNIRVLGIEGCEAARLTPTMPPLLTGGRHAPIQQVEPEKPEVKPPASSLLLDSPVRSGQSIVFPDGDVTVVGSVASGAEIVAGGSIHVYGTLRGRAMAGVNGNSSARIYCHKMEAELLAIDGYYQTAEEIPDALRTRPVQALLDGNVMRVVPLS
ncbi:Septum site-determining protein MinC [subsurface metagenome]|nr:MAG: septum formation inhibitor MinC [Bradyrhizobium icense]